MTPIGTFWTRLTRDNPCPATTLKRKEGQGTKKERKALENPVYVAMSQILDIKNFFALLRSRWSLHSDQRSLSPPYLYWRNCLWSASSIYPWPTYCWTTKKFALDDNKWWKCCFILLNLLWEKSAVLALFYAEVQIQDQSFRFSFVWQIFPIEDSFSCSIRWRFGRKKRLFITLPSPRCSRQSSCFSYLLSSSSLSPRSQPWLPGRRYSWSPP